MSKTIELSTAIETCRAAGDALLGYFRRPLIERKKGPINYVSEADLKSEEIISEFLTQRFTYRIIAEEQADKPPPDDRYWLVDPLDGTTNFLHGYPLFAVSIALVDAGVVQLGVVFDPLHDDLYAAERGKGAFLNDTPITVANCKSLSESLLATGFPYDSWTCPENPARDMGTFLRRVVSVRCDGSATLDLCHVACGRIDGYWERRLDPWDMAAGSLIVQEAGGRLSTAHGTPFAVGEDSIVAGNSEIHRGMLAILNDSD